MDRIEAMAMLLEVVERGSFSAASRSLKVPLATLSRRVSELEARLGTRLLTRTTRRLDLTDAGEAYVVAARRILDQLEEAERTAAGEFVEPKGELVITAPRMYGRLHVLPVVGEFLAVYPDIDIRLLLADRNVDLVGDHVDMAVRIGHLPDSSMIATRVGQLRTVTCASPALLAGRTPPSVPDDLRDCPCIALDTPTPTPAWRYQSPGSSSSVDIQIRPRLTVTSADAAAEAAIQGIGITRLLHYQVADALADGSLLPLLESYEHAPSPVHLLHASRGQMPLKMRSFLDFAAPRLRIRLEQLPPASCQAAGER